MVCTRKPECLKTLHFLAAYEYIRNNIIQGMSHVERTGHIGRWNYNRELGFLGISIGSKKPVIFPVFIPFCLDRLRIIPGRKIGLFFRWHRRVL